MAPETLSMAFAKAFSNDVHIAKYSTIQYIKRLLLGYGNSATQEPQRHYTCVEGSLEALEKFKNLQLLRMFYHISMEIEY